jgi:hypothetical protein
MSPILADYDHFQHRHNFAAWAAARAASRGLKRMRAGVATSAIAACGVMEFVRSNESQPITADEFDTLHREWCDAARKALHRSGVAGCTFGRAAKLIAVYLKAMVVVGPYWYGPLARVAHPPIDRILLQAAARATGGARSRDWQEINWTQLRPKPYYALIEELRGTLAPGAPFWRLEEYWKVSEEQAPTESLRSPRRGAGR